MSDNPSPLPLLVVDTERLSQITTLSIRHWERLRADGIGPKWHKLGRRIVYLWADVESWLREQPGAKTLAPGTDQ